MMQCIQRMGKCDANIVGTSVWFIEIPIEYQFFFRELIEYLLWPYWLANTAEKGKKKLTRFTRFSWTKTKTSVKQIGNVKFFFLAVLVLREYY